MTRAEATLAERRRQLAAPRAIPHSGPHDEAVLLEVSGRRYAIPFARVREVLPPSPLLALPSSAPQLRGGRVGRQGLLVIADLGALRGGPGVSDPGTCAVVVVEGVDPVGLLAERVTAEHVGPHTAPTHDSLIAGATPDGVLYVDIDALLADPRLRVATQSPGLPQPSEGHP